MIANAGTREVLEKQLLEYRGRLWPSVNSGSCKRLKLSFSGMLDD